MNPAPLLELAGLWRDFRTGDETVSALKGIDLSIRAGEMVAIVGPSGSGKSTLLNILGCLDRPSRGSYKVAGQEAGSMEPDALARLRREHFGFVFQRYQLLEGLDAAQNVEMPSIYTELRSEARHDRANQLLARLDLSDRAHHRPSQLSGGQQQRVSIARALMNGGDVILADEPTGALDSRTGQEVMEVLRELHRDGHTIIIITHDMKVASQAERIVELSDGIIVSDRTQTQVPNTARLPTRSDRPRAVGSAASAVLNRFGEAARIALRSMASHRLRSFLTMLGIIIGIASVVLVVALGAGARQHILDDLATLGANAIDVFPGRAQGDERSLGLKTLVPADAAALEGQLYVNSVTPRVTANGAARYRNVSARVSINGVGASEFALRSMTFTQGRPFSAKSIERLSQDVVIDISTRDRFFGKDADPVGKVLFIGNIPALVVGVAEARQSPFVDNQHLNVWMPYSTVMKRVLGQSHLEVITVQVREDMPVEAAERNIDELLSTLHRSKDFYLINANSMRATIEKTTRTMTFLISSIALISLVVGGIGVMNIMLVSVTERTGEIGIRMAVGARQSDIMQQFLIEAVLVCLIGGLLGIAFAFAFGLVFTEVSQRTSLFAEGGITLIYSNASIVVAILVSTIIGIAFGFLPARKAAKLDPALALARE
ncbi:MacB family efflux pump subunit [Herbaspirillum sp. GCM10030257]|uniref:MacB family efflux pump subunit n=1 Tax=Herbaspirillum sp. GCM10030257 TaxID=3273393 RepID=UPI00361A8F20